MIKHEINSASLLPMSREKAMKFVRTTDSFVSCIMFKSDRFSINGKSLLGLMSIREHPIDRILIVCDGPDEEDALEAILNALD